MKPIRSLVFLLLLVGCADLTRLDAVPANEKGETTVLGRSDLRYWGDETSTKLLDEAVQSVYRELALLQASGQPGRLPPAQFLAISGGGENGAYGAGLLVGWTATGTRPTFKLVTGISTGALTAPFAFLGPAYDGKLQEVYTTLSGKDVMQPRGYLAVVFDDALADNSPLRRTVAKYVDQAMLDDHRRRTRKGTCSAGRHHQSRCAASGHLEHHQDRRERPPARSRADPRCPRRLGRDPRRLPAGHDRRRGQRQEATRKCTWTAGPAHRCSSIRHR